MLGEIAERGFGRLWGGGTAWGVRQKRSRPGPRSSMEHPGSQIPREVPSIPQVVVPREAFSVIEPH